jgi:CTP:molybdopterin cytidylyltransferase MocA
VRIAAVLLAAGEGRRMGGPKALLRLEGEAFLAHAARLLARPGVETVIAVLGCEAETVRREVALPPGTITLVHDGWRAGMLSSFLCGLDEAERRGAEAVLLHHVDHPATATGTVDRVVAALQAGATIAAPSFEGRRGRPTGFARAAWPALRACSPEQGARQVLREQPEWVAHVEGDRECVAGVNTPEEYQALLARRPR